MVVHSGQIPAWLVGRLLLLLLLGSGQLSQIRHAWFVIDVINHSSSAPSCLAWLASPSHDIRSTTPVNTKQRRPLKASAALCLRRCSGRKSAQLWSRERGTYSGQDKGLCSLYTIRCMRFVTAVISQYYTCVTTCTNKVGRLYRVVDWRRRI